MKEKREEIRQIMMAVNIIDGVCAKLAKKIGVKENTLTLLYALDDGKSHSQKEICDGWLVPKTTLNTIIKECQKKDLIRLISNPGQKEKEICLTSKGKELAKVVLNEVYYLEEKALEKTKNIGFTNGMFEFAMHYHQALEEDLNESK